MAHTASVRKRVRSAAKKNMRNKSVRTFSKTSVTKAKTSISSGDIGAAEEAVKQAMIVLDKTASKGVIHPKNAARRKSRLMKSLNKARSQASSTPAE